MTDSIKTTPIHDLETCDRCMGSGYQGHPDDPAGCCEKCNGQGGVPQTTRAVIVPDTLGAIGLNLSADILEDIADTMKAFPLHAESAQLVADWLRQVAVAVPEAE